MQFARPILKPLICCLFSSLAASKAAAYAYIDNRGLLPIGDVESLMANTGAALSGSTGAVYFNPAGLATIERNHISLSANSYLVTHSEISPLQNFDGVDMRYSSDGVQAIPTAFVSTGHNETWRYAFSVLIPNQIRVQDSLAFSTPNYPSFQTSRTNFFQLMMIGLSAATHYEDSYDIGAGCFYTIYQTTQSSSMNAVTPSGKNSIAYSDYFDAQVTGALCNVGIQKQLSDLIRAGFTARLPMTVVSKKGTYSKFSQVPSNNGVAIASGPKSVEADISVPPDFTLGFEYRATDLLRIYLDLSYQLETVYSTGVPDDANQENRATPRISGALRYQLASSYELFGGLGYNPSSVITNERDYAEDFITTTGGARWSSGNSTLGLGFLYAQSTGHKTAGIYNASIQQTGSKEASVTTQAYGVLLSSGYVF